MDEKLNRAHAAAAARKEKFYAARRAGMGPWEAAAEAGVGEPATIRRYERWFQALERGEHFLHRGENDG